jgi:iron(III) transport system ATP-binding protein
MIWQQNPCPVTLSSVTKKFRDPKTRAEVHAVEECEFRREAGELVTLLVPSGCGKTTTLRMIGGFELPTKGRILIGDSDVTFLPPNGRQTATVFQSYGLFPHMDVYRQHRLRPQDPQAPGRSEIKERVEAGLELVGPSDLARRAPGRLSGGQQQRVALARSLVVEPQVLLLDEPLSNLDALLREQMRVEIRRIQKSLGITAIYVTHDRIEAMTFRTASIVMRDGRIQQIGSPGISTSAPSRCSCPALWARWRFFPAQLEGMEADAGPCARWATAGARGFGGRGAGRGSARGRDGAA